MKKSLLFLAAALTFGFAANAQTVFSEDFESVTVGSQAGLETGLGELPAGWTLYEDNLTNFSSSQSSFTVFGKSWKVYDMDGWGKLAFSITYTMEGTACDRWLITPAITIPDEGDYKLMFNQLASQYDEHMSVMVSTTNTEKASFTQTLIDNELLTAGASTRLLDLSSFTGQTIYIAFVAQTADGLYIGVDDVQVKVVAPDNMAALAATAPAWTAQGAYIPVSLAIRNEGSAPLTSFDIAYTVNSGDEQNISVTDINVAPFDTYTYTFQASPEGLGENVVDITVSNPNNADMAIENNTASCTTMVYDPANAIQRTTVLEHFTTGRCPNCPPAHDYLEQLYSTRHDNVIWIAHHVGYYTDNMTITESNQMLRFFNDGGNTYAPAIMLDRNQDYATAEDPGPVFFPSSNYTAESFDNAISTPAFVSVNISDVNYNPQSRELSLKVSGSFTNDMTFDAPRLTVYLMQDSIVANQSGASSSYIHNHVIRACVTNVWGDATAITNTTSGSTYEKTFTYTLPANMRADHTWAAAFVSNYDANNVNNCNIANGAKTGFLMQEKDPTSGIAGVEASINVVTYPNPATEMAFVTAEGTIRSYEMVDALGRKVMSQENVNADILELNVNSLSAGVYFISVTTDNGVATQRLTVAK